MKKIVLSALLLSLPIQGFANDFSYSFAEFSYLTGDVEVFDKNAEFDDATFDISYVLDDKLFAQFGYTLGEIDLTDAKLPVEDEQIDTERYFAGVGFHFPLQRDIDFFTSLNVLYTNMENHIYQKSDTGYFINSGVRARALARLDIEGGLTYVDIDENQDVGFNVGARLYVVDNLSVNASYYDRYDESAYLIGARIEF